MALEQTIWIKAIREQLFADNAFLNESINWDEYVQAGVKTVTIPQSGAGSGYERNRSTFPAEATERADTDITYDMTDYTSNPRRVRELEKVQLSYPKLQSVLNQDMAIIKEGAAEDILYNWRVDAADKMVRTTGESVDATISGSKGATGSRKRYKFADFLAADKIMNDMNIPQAGRVALISGSAKQDLLLDPFIAGNSALSTLLANYSDAVVLKIANFRIYVRSRALRYTNASTPVAKTPSAANAATDNDGCLCWHPNFVGKSMGNIKTFYNPSVATHYGDLFSLEFQAGGRKVETDGKGCVAIIQGVPA